MEKYGFVYIWYDCKHKRYYIGCHWGHEKDGYICSSPWMRQAYRHRPEDFKRRILNRVNERSELFKKEEQWLSLIKEEELRVRYYNLNKWAGGHWTLNEDHRTTRQKISDAGKRRIDTEETRQKKSEKAKENNTAKSILEWNSKPENIEIRRQWRLGKPRFGNPEKFKHTEETKQKISKANSGKSSNKGHKQTEETKRKISEIKKLGKWYNNGINEKLCIECPEGWGFGRLNHAGKKCRDTWINKIKNGDFVPKEPKKRIRKKKPRKIGPKYPNSFSEEHRKKLSDAKKGIKHSEETRLKRSLAIKEWWAKKKGNNNLNG